MTIPRAVLERLAAFLEVDDLRTFDTASGALGFVVRVGTEIERLEIPQVGEITTSVDMVLKVLFDAAAYVRGRFKRGRSFRYIGVVADPRPFDDFAPLVLSGHEYEYAAFIDGLRGGTSVTLPSSPVQAAVTVVTQENETRLADRFAAIAEEMKDP